MDHRIFYECMVTLFEEMDLADDNIERVFDTFNRNLTPIAQAIGLAKIEASLETVEDYFGNSRKVVPVTMDFGPTQTPREKAIVLDFSDLASQHGEIRMFPGMGVQWSPEDIRVLRNISKMVSLLLTRTDMQAVISEIPFRDTLTGLWNSRGIHRFGKRLGSRLEDSAGIFLNLVDFKDINKKYGNEAGNEVIRQVAAMLRESVHEEKECVGRLGGDNFFLLLERVRAVQWVERMVRDGVTCILMQEGKKKALHVDVRMGVNLASGQNDIFDIVNNAAISIQFSKRSGERAVVFTQELMEKAVERKRLVARIPEAMRRREIVAYYQPKVNCDTMQLCGCEALARWMVDGQSIPPSIFIPAVEEAGEVTRLDFYMLEQVCRDLRSWIDMGLEPVRVSVNYSRKNLAEPDLAGKTLEILKRWDINPHYIEIELTETTDLADRELINRFIVIMQRNGIKISMDDFGTGYSSINQFKELDFDVVKLDKSLIDNIEKDVKKDATIMRNMIQMLSDLNCEIVAEGVETSKQLGFLKQTECNVIQGFFFDRPLSPEEFSIRLNNKKYIPVQ